MDNTSATKTPRRVHILAAFAAVYLIWGSTYLGIRIAIETIPAFLMIGFRFVIAGTILYTWLRLRGVERPRRVHWRSAAIIGALMVAGGTGMVAWSEQRVASGLAALLVAMVPLWIVLLDWLRPGGSQPPAVVVGGVVLGLLGIVLLIDPANLAGGPRIDVIGAGALMFATLSWASGSLYSRQASLPDRQQMGTALEMLVGGTLLVLVGSATGEWARFDLAAITARSWLALAYLITFGSLVAFSAYLWLLKAATPAKAATYAYVNPVVALFLGWALAGEPLGPRVLVAAAIVLGAVVIVTSYRPRPQAVAQPSSGGD
jgi:drug/metabolite transporter (DMT)-like permease